MAKNILEFKHVGKRYDDNVVLRDIDFEVEAGKFYTLLGPSGSGKTTILRIIAGFDQASSGEILFDGQPINNVPANKRQVNTVFQDYALFPHMNVAENVAFGLQIKGVKKTAIRQRVKEALHLVRLAGYGNREITAMSGGQRQRVAIARAIVNRPKVLLLDEALSALDHKLRVDMQRELRQLQRQLGITFIFVTHDQEEALTMSDRIVIMDKGEIQQDDDPNTIYHYPKTKFVAGFIGESNFFDNGKEILVLRPEKLNLCGGKDGDDSHPAPRFFGTVDDVIFYGTIDKVFIRLDGTGQEVLAYQYFDDVHRWQINDHVGIWWYEKDEVRVER